MSDKPLIEGPSASEIAEVEVQGRREFLVGLGRWSKIVIGAALFGGFAAGAKNAEAGAWVNHRGYGGGAWVNNRGGGGAWVNRRY
jgi:hypothetical protein